MSEIKNKLPFTPTFSWVVVGTPKDVAKKDIILGASNGKAIRFNEQDVRSMGRTASGVRGMNISEADQIVGAAIIESDEQEILVVTEKGYGKRTNVDEYRCQMRGGKGVKTLNVTDKNGRLCTLKAVSDEDDLIVVSDKGVVIRTHVDQISKTKRATQGVRVIKLRTGHHVATIALVPKQEDEEEEIVDQEQFEQVSIPVEEQKKTIETKDLEPDEVDEIKEEVVSTDSLFDEED